MAYANLIGVTAIDKADVFCRLRDFICKRSGTYDYSTTGIGWTLLDSSYAVDEDNPQLNDWFVVKSTGEGGKEDMYFKVTWSTGYIYTRGYLAWNTTSHTGSSVVYGGTTVFSITETLSNQPMYIYGDLDMVIGVCRLLDTSTDYVAAAFGKAEKPYEGSTYDIATSSGAVSSGSDVSITVDAVPATWVVGRSLYIRTTTDVLATCEVEVAEIKTIVGNTITCDLTNTYTANFRLSEHLGYFAQSNYALGGGIMMISPSGAFTQLANPVYNSGLASTSGDPDVFEDRWVMVPSSMIAAAGFLGTLRHCCRVSQGALVNGDVLETIDGSEYRYFKTYSNAHFAFREV